MLTPRLIEGATFKKEYNFEWKLGGYAHYVSQITSADRVASVLGEAKKWANAVGQVIKSLTTSLKMISWEASGGKDVGKLVETVNESLNPADDYISQLAFDVSLPEDSVEMDNVNFGILTMPVPKRRELGNITVKYYEDSFGNVYNYHKIWQNLAFTDSGSVGNSITVNPIKECTRSALYVSYENALNDGEFAAMEFSSITSSVVGQAASSVGLTVDENDLYDYRRFTSVNEYPNIYPIRIGRSEGKKNSSSLATVTVTYIRVPDFLGTAVPHLGVTDLNGKKREP